MMLCMQKLLSSTAINKELFMTNADNSLDNNSISFLAALYIILLQVLITSINIYERNFDVKHKSARKLSPSPPHLREMEQASRVCLKLLNG